MNKIHLIWICGVTLSLIMGLLAFFGFKNCEQNIGCLIFLIIPGYPGLSLGLTGFVSILTSFIFWFLFGSLIGFLVYKFKK